MPSDLSSYLATHYLTADTKPTKKRKRKHDKSSGGGLLIQDDDEWGSGSSSHRRSRAHGGDGDEDDNSPVTVGKVKEFRKTTKANWKTVGGRPAADDAEAAAADAILASAAAENEAARKAEDDDPTVVEESSDAAAAAARMADGTHAGLQSAAAVTAQLERRQKEEREQFEAERRAGVVKHGEEETYYRDATGRRVDVSMKRAEARRAALEAEEKERMKEEMLKGEVQLEEARKRKEVLEDARGMAVARTADDEEMNRELKEQRRWNDPMARFLDAEEERAGPKTSAGGVDEKGSKKASRKPVYKGPAPPNRYGIRPGYRWDGVDRSNGFEAERFKAINRRERNKGLDYAWQMDE
ncbi:hypothetical protein M406DRAFT_288544 [Cryphonectria parasitica EP155]|uniref:Pre-mRNA-splicing factor CWC26 n=1 Tax=Cryphonectria parasitica (strain ATCC 38755 / EP155) TaxID=660469 RepID=A0A9P4Y6N6_CRYP1|nr:uncharacterized protein M406DRAFT_288544 [Cryphonectria parasitica EP155]KAF3767471.1 hypothetical protein M406DRAFT_288544 [Cryphonectria parasitica EP155]